MYSSIQGCRFIEMGGGTASLLFKVKEINVGLLRLEKAGSAN